MHMLLRLVTFMLIVTFARHAPAQTATSRPPSDAVRRTMTAQRAAESPKIDGALDEAVWRVAPAATDFIQFQPNPGVPASQRTEARVLYDDAAVYVGVRMFDSRPDSIVAALARRDEEVYSDWIYVGIDSYFDRRTAFVFALNPRGVKFDAMLFDDTNDDDSWDAIWDGAAQIDSAGWTAEFRIPLSQLRFSAMRGGDATRRTWGLQFLRKLARRNEESFWSPMRREDNAVVSRFGELQDLRGLQPPRRLEVQPYGMSRLTRAPGNPADPFFRRNDGQVDAGADFKYGLTPAVTLTGTINPDFGQVEADPSVVNLSAFESFFSERRPFFVEGADIFRFGIGIGDGDGGSEGLFYSRRIGRAPQASMPDEARWQDVPDAAPILGAAKVSGKTRGWSLGLLNALTGEVEGRFVASDGTRGTAVIEPLSNFAVARVIRDFRAGQSALGIIGTATNRRLDDDRLVFLRGDAYTSGLSARHRWQGGNYQLNAWLAGSHIRGDTSAIRIAQTSSARYFQRPEIAARLDPTRRALSGWGGAVELLKFGGGHWRFGGITNVRSPGFEVNDLGFMRSADQIVQAAFLGYDGHKPSRRLQRWNLFVNQWNGYSFAGERIATGGNVNGGFTLPSFWGFHGGVNREFPALSPHALRGGPAFQTQGNTNLWINAFSDDRRRVRGSLFAHRNRESGTDGRSVGIETTVRVRASNRMEVSLAPGYFANRDPAQYVASRSAGGATFYVFGGLDQTTTLLTTRLNYTFTPTLSFQLYAQPFISGGAFGRFHEVRDPRARRFADRFRTYASDQLTLDAADNEYAVDRDGDGVADFSFGNPDFNVKALRTNAVVRWEYNPGSTLFVVWSQGRGRSDSFGDYRFARDASDLFRVPPTNVLLVKVNYWLGL